VSEEETQMNGYYHLEEKRIVIKRDNSPDQKAKTVVHEIAHATMHLKGLDTSEYSFGYLASWKGDEGKMQEIGVVVMEISDGLILGH